MEENRHPLKNIHVTIRRSPVALKILLGVLIVLSMAALIALQLVHSNIQTEIKRLQEQANAVEYRNGILDERIQDPASFENIVNIAKEELGLVDPDTVIIDPQ